MADIQHRLTKSGKIDGRIFNGGARKGAGRPLSPYRQAFLKFALEKVVVKEIRHGQVRRVKKTRLQLSLEMLFRAGTEGEGNVKAINMWLDRALGKPDRGEENYDEESKTLKTRGHGYSPALRRGPTEIRHLNDLLESAYDAEEQMIEGTFIPKPPLPPGQDGGTS